MLESSRMYVVKRPREGETEPRREKVDWNKISKRIRGLAYELHDNIDPDIIAQQVIAGVKNGIHTSELDILAARISHGFTTTHPDYSNLAARLLISNLHKETSNKFSEVIEQLYTHIDKKYNESMPLVSKEVYDVVKKHADLIDSKIIQENDFKNYDYFGYKTLETSYLTRIDGKIVERPQYMLMRVSIGIHGENLERVLETYELMSNKYFTHATPTLFNAGMKTPQLSSCYLLNVNDDISSIMKVVGDCGKLSKHAGGIGIHFSSIRTKGSRIRGTHGTSKGIVPFLKIYNATANAVDQSGRRPGSFAVYLEPWHADIMAFLELRMNNGNDHERARELFTALWINDVFMERVEADTEWSLMCPDECPGLVESYGDEFRTLYKRYEREGKYRRQVKAQDVWKAMMASQRQTGTPYVLNKDAANRRNNQMNLGTLKGSNLCAEILIYTDEAETGTCNLASLALGQYIDGERYDFQKLHDVARVVTRNLNRVIDINYYPIPEAKNSNLKHRPIAIGVQGLWDTFMRLRIPFTSPEAQELNKKIFETIYHGFLTESCELAKIEGPYKSFQGSPLSQGKFQFDLWNKEAREWNKRHVNRPDFEKKYKRDLVEPSNLWDWDKLRAEIRLHGVRNSLGIALMPTASTSNIMGFMECFECITSNMYVRRTKAGEFYVVNRYLIDDLIKLGLWNEDMRDRITLAEGSIQGIDEIPQELKELHKTNWEQSQKEIINLSIGRAPFVDHTESHNTYISDPQENRIHTNLMYKWRMGLKTLSYYLRQQVKGAVKFSVDATKTKDAIKKEESVLVCTRDNPDCESCSG